MVLVEKVISREDNLFCAGPTTDTLTQLLMANSAGSGASNETRLKGKLTVLIKCPGGNNWRHNRTVIPVISQGNKN